MVQEDRLAKVLDFIQECKQHEHYAYIESPPEAYSYWKEIRQTRQLYFKWIMKHSNCPSLRLSIDIPHREILAEAENANEYFVKHRGNNHPGWESMTLHGQGIHYTDNIKQYPDAPQEYNWTELTKYCPITTEWFKDVWPNSGNMQRVRFMMLRPGGWITPHQDLDRREISAFNIALSNPEGCEFAMEDANIIPWKPGDVRGIDVGRKHCVYNGSNQDRIHMIVHDNWSPNKYDLVCQAYDDLLIENNTL